MSIIATIIVEDHPIVIEGIKVILNTDTQYQYNYVAYATNGDVVLSLLRQHKPQLLILDLNLPIKSGIDILPAIRTDFPDLRILIITMYNDARLIKTAFKAGADGYLLKTTSREELLQAVSEVMIGKTYLGKGVDLLNNKKELTLGKPNAVAGSVYGDKFIRRYNLTRREIEILKLISQALSNKEIGKELYISDQTVSVHRKNLMRKLGVTNTAGLIKLAYEHSII